MAVQSITIELSKLIYDPQNPRLPMKVRNLDDMDTIDYMLRNGNIIELMQSIAEMGYSSAEPLLVVKATEGDKYIVVEGNRRLTALKLIDNAGLAKVRIQQVNDIANEAKHIPTEIPCILYDTREEILSYLGYRHITGIKEWGSLEKARYLKELFDLHKEREGDGIYRTLAKMIGSRSDYVERLLGSLELYSHANNNAYFGSDITEDEINFSYFTTAMGYKSIVNYININFNGNLNHLEGINEGNYRKLFLWLFDKNKRVVKEIRNISKLAAVVDFPIAIEKLDNGASLDVAMIYTSEPENVFFSNLDKASDYLKEAKTSIEQLSNEPEGYDDRLTEIEKLVKSIRGAVEENFSISKSNVLLTREEYEKIKGLLEQIKE